MRDTPEGETQSDTVAGGCRCAPLRSSTMQLTDDDKAVLDFERSWWKHPGAKEAAIRETFDLSATR